MNGALSEEDAQSLRIRIYHLPGTKARPLEFKCNIQPNDYFPPSSVVSNTWLGPPSRFEASEDSSLVYWSDLLVYGDGVGWDAKPGDSFVACFCHGSLHGCEKAEYFQVVGFAWRLTGERRVGLRRKLRSCAGARVCSGISGRDDRGLWVCGSLLRDNSSGFSLRRAVPGRRAF